MSLSAGPWRPATAAFPFEFWDTGGPNFASPALAWLGLRVSARADRFIGTPSRCHVDSNMSLLSGEPEKLLLAVAQLLVALEQQVRDGPDRSPDPDARARGLENMGDAGLLDASE